MKNYPKQKDVQIGNIFRNFLCVDDDKNVVNKFILARTDDHLVTLISLLNGNRWIEPVEVLDVGFITKKEIKKIFNCDKHYSYWKLDFIEKL
jgi:hypothetical protein